jgi:hypothetical protein
MKIKKFESISEKSPFDYNNDYDDDITVHLEFSGTEKIDLQKIKNTEYYIEHYSPDMNDAELDSLIFYSIEQYIYEIGLIHYSNKLFDKNNNEIDLKVYLDSDKYNL